MSVKEIESAIAQLSPKELVELISWLGQHHAQIWDKTIEEDLEAGGLTVCLPKLMRNTRQGWHGRYDPSRSPPLRESGLDEAPRSTGPAPA